MYAYLSQIQMIQLTQFDEKWEIICRCPLLLSMFSQVDWHQVLSLNKSFHTFNVCLLCIHFCNGCNIPVFIQELQEHLQTSHWLFSRQARDLVIWRNGGLNCHHFWRFFIFAVFIRTALEAYSLLKISQPKKMSCVLLWGKGHRRSFEL